jgi:hypothetical protein
VKIVVKFKKFEPLWITVNDTSAGRLYFDLTRNQNKQQKYFYRDTLLWTEEYLVQLAYQAKQAFGWDWFSEKYDLSVTTRLHKDLENSLGKLGFENIQEKHDLLLYDLHHCLHAVQNGTRTKLRSDNFQIEWLTDVSLPLPEDFEFVTKEQRGDLILINPYVGHNPLQIYRENDFSSLQTTCRFHDVIKPAIVIVSQDKETPSKKTIADKFLQQDPGFVSKHGYEKIQYYSGNAIVGHVDNLEMFAEIQSCPNFLDLESIDFYE